jgi:hypothetical protein
LALLPSLASPTNGNNNDGVAIGKINMLNLKQIIGMQREPAVELIKEWGLKPVVFDEKGGGLKMIFDRNRVVLYINKNIVRKVENK